MERLHDYLNSVSSCTTVKLYDIDGNMLFYGDAAEITETIMFTNWNVVSHRFEQEILFIWIE